MRRCHRERAVGRGFSTGARLLGVRDERESGFFCVSPSAAALSPFLPPSVCCDFSPAKRLLSAKSPIFIAKAFAAFSCSLSLALTLAAAASGSGIVVFGVARGFGSGPLRCGRLLGVAN